MHTLNYHHLLYFWTVAHEGTIASACKRLRLDTATISGQLRSLEKALSAKLFDRVGRNLVLTETGRTVYRYADEIFPWAVNSRHAQRTPGRSQQLVVGVADVLPKSIVYRLLEPVLHLPEPVHLIVTMTKQNRC